MSPVEKPTQADREAAARLARECNPEEAKWLVPFYEQGGDSPLSEAFMRHRLAADQAARTTTDAAIAKALEPVMHWYQSDEHEPRPLYEIVADAVADLQQDRATVLQATRTTTTEGEALVEVTKRLDLTARRLSAYIKQHGMLDDRDDETLAFAVVALNEAKAILATPPATPAGGGEPFGYWVEQKGAEPALLRKPAYIPEPSDLRKVTPLFAAPSPDAAPAGEANA